MISIYFCVFIMTLTGSFASLFLKKISDTEKDKSYLLKILENKKNNKSKILEILKKDIVYKFIILLENINLYIGGILYLTAAILNIYVLKYLDYSIVLPLTSITYIWTMIISKIYLNEKITKLKILGVVLISTGSYLLTIV